MGCLENILSNKKTKPRIKIENYSSSWLGNCGKMNHDGIHKGSKKIMAQLFHVVIGIKEFREKWSKLLHQPNIIKYTIYLKSGTLLYKKPEKIIWWLDNIDINVIQGVIEIPCT